MVAISPIPKEELKRLAQANTTLVEVARKLLTLAEENPGTPDSLILQTEIGRLVDSSKTISEALRSTEYVGAARR